MSIIPSPTLRRHPGSTPTPSERPRAVAPARLGCAPGASRDVLADLRAFAAREQHRPQPQPRPWPGLMHAVGATHAVCLHADIVLDDLSDLAESWIDLLEPLVAAGVDHAVRMVLLPVAALLAEPLDGGAHSTWDHRPLGKPVGRELGTEDTPAVTR